MEASGSVQPLSQFPIVCTARLDEARDAVTRVYLPHRLDSSDGDRLQMTLNAAEAPASPSGFSSTARRRGSICRRPRTAITST